MSKKAKPTEIAFEEAPEVKRRAFRTMYNNKEYPKTYEKVSPISETVPDQAMTVTQIVQRFNNGYSVPGGKTPVWMHPDEEEDDLSSLDLSTLDFAERQEIVAMYQQELSDIRARQKAAEQRAKDAAREAMTPKVTVGEKADQSDTSERTQAPQSKKGSKDA